MKSLQRELQLYSYLTPFSRSLAASYLEAQGSRSYYFLSFLPPTRSTGTGHLHAICLSTVLLSSPPPPRHLRFRSRRPHRTPDSGERRQFNQTEEEATPPPPRAPSQLAYACPKEKRGRAAFQNRAAVDRHRHRRAVRMSAVELKQLAHHYSSPTHYLSIYFDRYLFDRRTATRRYQEE